MRALLDSNVLARALYSVGGPAEEAVRRLAAPPHVLIVSSFLLTELRRVLRYPRLQLLHGLDDQKIDRAVTALETAATLVDVPSGEVVQVVPHDPDDDHIVAAAVVGRAEVICTRNNHLYHEAVVAYCRQHAIEILGDVELLARLRASESREG
jgi:uncharacterized protein